VVATEKYPGRAIEVGEITTPWRQYCLACRSIVPFDADENCIACGAKTNKVKSFDRKTGRYHLEEATP